MANLLQKASIVLTPTAYDNGKVLCAKPSEPPYGDFDFSRNSAATRVNAQGLVENVQILSSNLVQNPSFSEEGVQEVSNGSFSQEGSELITNGDFSNGSTDWILDSGWSVSDNKALCDGTNLAYITQTAVLTTGKSYKVQFDIVDYTSGSIKYRDNGFVSGQSFSGVGSYTDYVVAGGGQFRLMSENFIGSIDNVSVREVGQDWTLNNWSVGDSLVLSGNTSILSQTNIYTSATSIYKTTFRARSVSGASVTLRLYDGANAFETFTITSSTFEDFTLTRQRQGINAGLYFYNNSDAEIEVTNISVKEVLQDWSVEDYGAVSASAVITPNTEGVKLEKTVSADWRSSFLVQPISYTFGSQYKVTFRLKNGNLPSGGSVYVRREYDSSSQSIAEGLVLTNDWVEYTYYFVANAGSTDISFGNVNWQNAGVGQYFYIDDVSVIEITDDTNLPRINYEGFSYQDALGSELVTNGDFENNIDFWAQYLSLSTWDNGTIKTTSTSSVAWIRQNDILSSGKIYTITFKAKSTNISQNIKIWNGADFVDTNLSFDTVNEYKNFTYQLDFSGGGGQHIIIGQTSISIGDSVNFDNVSVKEYLGQEVVPDSGCGSWLFEPQSTNLIPYSEDFSQWIGSGCTVGNSSSVVSPSNSNNIGIITGTIGTGAKFARINVITSSSILTYSAFFKYNSHQWVQFASGATSEYANFDIQNGVVGGKLSGTTATIDNFGNGWYRCTLSTSVASTPSNMALVLIDTANSSRLDATSSVGSVYIWGAQLEKQSYATSYIPTSGSTVTRNQDVCTNGGSLASINSTEGVLYAEIAALVNDLNIEGISISDGSTSNRVVIFKWNSSNTIRARVSANGVNVLNQTISVTNITDFNKIAISYKLNDFKVYINGTNVFNDTSGATPIGLNTLSFSTDGTSSAPFFGKTKALAVWKEALSDQELADLTYPTPTDPTFALDFDTIATDFTFARGSEATYVDAQGLIQSTNEIGEELITNGDFATDSDWNKNGAITISGGTANFNNSASGNNVEQAVTLPSGKQYIATYEITSITEGKFSIYVGGVLSGNQNNQVGVYTEVFTSIGGNAVYVRARGTTTGSIDNVSVKEYKTATNTPRLDYSTGAEAFLLEPQSTNLLTYSEDYSNVAWTKTGSASVTSNTTISPDGTQNADTLNLLSGNFFYQPVVGVGTFTLSCYVKVPSGTLDFKMQSFNGTDGAIQSPIFVATTEWQRFEHTVTVTVNSSFYPIQVSGLVGGDFEIWGAQVEQQSYATSYIPTSGTTVTRNQETCINATPEINSEEGVLYAEISALANDLTDRDISISDGTNNNVVRIRFSRFSNNIGYAVLSNGVTTVGALVSGQTQTNTNKIAVKYKQDDFALWVNGVEVATDTSGNTPIGLSSLQFTTGNVALPLFGNTKDVQVYTKALSDAELIKLTT